MSTEALIAGIVRPMHVSPCVRVCRLTPGTLSPTW